MTAIETHLSLLKEQFGSKLIKAEISDINRIRIQANNEDLLKIMGFIALDLGFTSLEAVSGLDWETYFEVVYHIDRWDGDPAVIQVHVQLDDRENPIVHSVTSIWKSANWHEREVYDLFGIKIENHPNLKRLLLPEEWDEYEHKHISELYPMRREYKLPEKPYSLKPHPK